MSTIDDTAREADAARPAAASDQVELTIGGMTCASCANRIERKLNKLDGVTATVNYATEKAKVTYDRTIDPATLVETVEQAGYTAELPRPASPEPGDSGAHHDHTDASDDAVRTLRRRLIVSAALSVPVIAMAMIPALQFTNW